MVLFEWRQQPSKAGELEVWELWHIYMKRRVFIMICSPHSSEKANQRLRSRIRKLYIAYFLATCTAYGNTTLKFFESE